MVVVRKGVAPTTDELRKFFARSDFLDADVLKPLDHIASAWDATWDQSANRYAPEPNSFAGELNRVIDDIATTAPPDRYHDNEDALAQYVIETLRWQIRKENGRWVGSDYQSILEQGGFDDIDQGELLTAATGRVYAAFKFGQSHYDQMEESHRRMLGAIVSIILYHRFNVGGAATIDGSG